MTDKPVQETHIDTEHRIYEFVNHQAGTIYTMGLVVISTLALLATKLWQWTDLSWWWVAAPAIYMHSRMVLFRLMRNAFHSALLAEKQMFENNDQEITMAPELVAKLDPSLVNIFALDKPEKNPTS